MRRKVNRQDIDTLYVLGAGASYALSYVNAKNNSVSRLSTPLDINFINCLEAFKPKNGWQKASTEKIFNNWLDRGDIRTVGLEEAIIKRVSQYEFLSKFHRTRIQGKISNSDYLNHLSHLVCAYLKKCRSNSSGNTKAFTNHIFPVGTSVENYKNRIVTFNYDTLIDRQLIERNVSRRKIYFDRLVKSRGDGIRRDQDEKFAHPLILKLHGSINWRCERSHFDQLISGDVNQEEKLEIWFEEKKLPKPDDDESPLIIPPIPNKPITASSLFNFLWTCAFEYMHEARRMVIVGYSCPSTDTLARTMFGQFKSKNLEEIIVIDPNALALKSYREMIDPKVATKAKWRYYSDFREYIDAGLS
ncbi:hypothetical protein A3765_08475 [Oleiphilus sp. HI0130]|nr:hypothetical protein A3765_08475 [Oleiphilus sp. HI0130]